ncbi:hypothetical protein Tco_1279362 [Tanacetum coccineum]
MMSLSVGRNRAEAFCILAWQLTIVASMVIYAANFIEFFAKEAKRVYGDVIPSPYPDLKQPVVKFLTTYSNSY